MHSHGDYDPWAEYRARREEWRARRHERREAWREARRQRCAERHERWASWGMMHHGFGHSNFGMGPGAGAGPGGSQAEDLKVKVASMQATIEQLLQRVAVLEKLATDDDRKLAAEIERLRDNDRGQR